jgi:hypothetical protein
MERRRQLRSLSWLEMLNIHTQLDSERAVKSLDLPTGYFTIRMYLKETEVYETGGRARLLGHHAPSSPLPRLYPSVKKTSVK